MIKPQLAPTQASIDILTPKLIPAGPEPSNSRSRWEARHELEQHRAETERLRVLVDFLARPIHAHGGSDPDPDIVTAYNLAVEAALHSVRKAARSD